MTRTQLSLANRSQRTSLTISWEKFRNSRHVLTSLAAVALLSVFFRLKVNISKYPRMFNILGRRCGGWWTSAARPGVLSSLPVSSGEFFKPAARWSKYQCCGSGMFIPDPGSDVFHPGSASKNLSILTQQKWFLSSRKYDPGCLSRIPDPDPYFLPILDPGVKKAPDPGSRMVNTGTYWRSERIEYLEAHARLLFGYQYYKTSPIIWIGKPTPAIQC